MKKGYYFILIPIISMLMGIQPLTGQQVSASVSTVQKKQSPGKIKWMTNPFDHQVFIENGGQFTGPPNSDKILYGAQVGDVYVYITSHGLIYKSTQYPGLEKQAGKEATAADPDDIDWKKVKPVDYYMTATWEGSKGATNIVAGEEKTNYYTYPGANNGTTIKVNIFKTITCQNIYPGIDIKYSFLPGKDGFKYALIVHAGTDISQIKLKYKDAKKITIDKDGNIQINNGWGTFTDHAPKSYYDGESDTITSSYQLQNNTESFHITNPNPGKTLVIDPWVTNWSSAYKGNAGNTGAYDVDYDYAGNVYVYGSFSSYQLAKYNSAGVQQWTYNASNLEVYPYYGGFCVDKLTGASFCVEGCAGSHQYGYVVKVSTSGAFINIFNKNTLYEEWRAHYDICSHTIAVAGGGTWNSYQSAVVDTNNSTCTEQNILGVPIGQTDHDMCVLAADPIVDTTYMAVARAGISFNNVIVRAPMPTLSPSGLITSDGFGFTEVGSVSYVAPGTGSANGMNGLAISPDWIYMYDGENLRQ